MPVYCDINIIQVKLPEPYPALIKKRVDEALTEGQTADEDDYKAAWETELEALIAKFSEYIDTRVGDTYQYVYKSGAQKFADIGDSPQTPAIIYEICRLLCIDGALEYYYPTQTAKATSEEQTYRELAEKDLDRLLRGEMIIKVPAAPGSYDPDNAVRSNVMTESNFDSFGKGI